jgi:hypothetical protein
VLAGCEQGGHGTARETRRIHPTNVWWFDHRQRFFDDYVFGEPMERSRNFKHCHDRISSLKPRGFVRILDHPTHVAPGNIRKCTRTLKIVAVPLHDANIPWGNGTRVDLDEEFTLFSFGLLSIVAHEK